MHANSPSPLLTVIILTRDEEQNLVHALESLSALDAEVWIIDSGSRDATLDIARAHGCRVLERRWTSYADQFNWALSQIDTQSPWIMRLDADERLTPELVEELRYRLSYMSDDTTGLMVRRQVHFWGRWIRHGGYYPTWLLRIWRNGMARCEARWMDEHMVVEEGRIERLFNDIIDENHKGLGFWTIKHEGYAAREVRDLLAMERGSRSTGIAGQAGRRRLAKERIYARAPRLWRAGAYWFMRYFLQAGFLDGREGLVFHFLQGFWYRFLVDARLIEEERQGRLQHEAPIVSVRPEPPARGAGGDGKEALHAPGAGERKQPEAVS